MDKSLSPEILKVLQGLVLPLELKINSLLDAVRSLELKLDEKNATQSTTKDGKPKTLLGDRPSAGQRQTYATTITSSRTPTAAQRVDLKPIQRPGTRKQRVLAASTADQEQSAPPSPASFAQSQVPQTKCKIKPSGDEVINGAYNTSVTLQVASDVLTELPEESSQDSHQWRYVRGKQRKPSNRGAGDVDADLATVEKMRQIHLWSIRSDVTPEQVQSFMAKKCSTGAPYVVEKLKLRHASYASFVITVPESLFEFFMTAKNWPPNAEFNEWFRRRAGTRNSNIYQPLSQSDQ